MIPINDYRQFIAELINYACRAVAIEDTPTIRLAVTESQLVSLLKDTAGIVIAGNIPGADFTFREYPMSEGECLLMVLEKMPADIQGLDVEFNRLAILQHLMVEIVMLLADTDGFGRFCDNGELDFSRPLTVEWEYNTYGGFNGLSVTFRLKDKQI